MSFNSVFEAEMRRYQQEQIAASIGTTLTKSQLRHSIEQDINPNTMRRRRASDYAPQKPKRPLIFRFWFIMLASTLVSGVYFVKSGHIKTMRNITNNIEATTGVDVLSISTYKKLLDPISEEEGTNLAPAGAMPNAGFAPNSGPQAMPDGHMPFVAPTNYNAQSMDIRDIEAEALRLDEMAREFDRQMNNQPQE